MRGRAPLHEQVTNDVSTCCRRAQGLHSGSLPCVQARGRTSQRTTERHLSPVALSRRFRPQDSQDGLGLSKVSPGRRPRAQKRAERISQADRPLLLLSTTLATTHLSTSIRSRPSPLPLPPVPVPLPPSRAVPPSSFPSLHPFRTFVVVVRIRSLTYELCSCP